MRHRSLDQVDHRPWALPSGPWTWRQSWLDLAFIHYRVDPALLRPRVPAKLQVEVFDGSAWVSVVPFRMSDIAPGRMPSVWPLRNFPELNVRTYVTDGVKPGVWFFSLDADCLPIVLGGRLLYGLPYHASRMSLMGRQGTFVFRSLRNAGRIRFDAEYQGEGDVYVAAPGTLEHWLTERYCLYSRLGDRVRRLEVHHKPWPLCRGRISIAASDVLPAAKIQVFDEPPLCHVSSGVEVISYAPVVF